MLLFFCCPREKKEKRKAAVYSETNILQFASYIILILFYLHFTSNSVVRWVSIFYLPIRLKKKIEKCNGRYFFLPLKRKIHFPGSLVHNVQLEMLDYQTYLPWKLLVKTKQMEKMEYGFCSLQSIHCVRNFPKRLQRPLPVLLSSRAVQWFLYPPL